MASETLNDLIKKFQNTVRRGDMELAARLMRQYRIQRRMIEAELRRHGALIRNASGTVDAERWIVEQAAIRNLLNLAEREMNQYARFAAEQIEARRLELIRLSALHDEKLTFANIAAGETVTPATRRALQAAFNSIPVDAVQAAVGALSDGSALTELFDSFGVKASRNLGESLLRGITRGDGAEKIARGMRESLDGNAARSLTIARTETHRAYRSASLDRYRGNTGVYAGWEWYAELDNRTCAVCYAKHGSVHSVDEEFGGHPNCRCRPIPITKSVSEILGETSAESLELDGELLAARASQNSGAEQFSNLSAATQNSILGPTKGNLYRSGQISLDDIVVERTDPRWGLTHRTASTSEALANAARSR